MERKNLTHKQLKAISDKFNDTELAFEYEMGVQYQKDLMKHHEQLQKRKEKKEGESSD